MSVTTNADVAVHVPVMLDQVVDALQPALNHPGAVLVDATVGLGGHSAALLDACPGARLVGIDRDGQALELAAQRLARFDGRVELVRQRFDALPEVLDGSGIKSADAILFDLGVSSLQIDDAGRGFAYSKDGPVDMRMDDRLAVDAATIVNTWPVADLTRIFRDYGEEPNARRVAQAIADARAAGPITSTSQLSGIVVGAMPAAIRFGDGGHPAKRVFQALRITVNGELEALGAALPLAFGRLASGGRIAVLSYHSLEDRLVKHAFADAVKDRAPRLLPIVPPELKPQFHIVGKPAQRPADAEIALNRRATSARLRTIEKEMT